MANIKDKTITKLSDLKQYQATVELTREPHHFNVHQAMENTVQNQPQKYWNNNQIPEIYYVVTKRKQIFKATFDL